MAIEGYEIKQYKRRWLNMLVFVVYAVNGGCQYLQFTIIKDIIIKYYKVSSVQVEWTSNIYMLAYAVLIVPSLYLWEKVGIKTTISIASAGICVGAWIKLFSVAPDRFYLVLLGQSFEAIFTIFTFSLAARFTAVWFGAHEISRAGAFALFGDQLGSALAFLLPTVMVHDSPEKSVIGNGLQKMHGTIAVSSTIIFFLILLLFKDQPKQPASVAQAIQKEAEVINLMKSLIKMLKNRAFVMITVSYSLCVGSATALWTLFNELILINIPNSKGDAGNIGCIIMLAGMLSSPIFAYILDRTRKFKENAIGLCSGTIVSLILFLASLKTNNMIYIYSIAIVLGIFAQSLYVTGVQMGIEVMYPMSEAVISAVMFFWAQIIGLIMTTAYSALLKTYGDFIANAVLCGAFFLSAIISLLIPANLKRQKAENSVKARELEEFIPGTKSIN